MEGSIFKSIWSPIKSVFKLLNADRIAIVIILIILGYATWISFFKEDKKLNITANLLSVDKNTWRMRGRVLTDGIPVDGARVWIILRGHGSNEDSPPAVLTNKQGEFIIDSIPRSLGESVTIPAGSVSQTEHKTPIERTLQKDGEKVDESRTAGIQTTNLVREINIYAFSLSADIKGEKKIVIGRDSGYSPVPFTHDQLVLLGAIFLISIIIPFLRVSARLKYSLSLILAFLFTVVLIFYISRGLYYVSDFTKKEVLDFGFGNIRWGSYDKEIQSEWLFSLTAPPEKFNTPEWSTPGFGVPLWVLLLSVIGSSLFTLLIIVSEIKGRPDFDKLNLKPDPDPDELKIFREKIENIVRHQFYMLFSPLGAIFIYQLLVAADAARQPITVALAALGAGSTLNILLDKAVLASKKAFGKLTEEEEKLEAGKLKKGKV